MGEIFENHISEKRLVFRIHKELSKFNDKRNNPIKKRVEDLDT